MRDQPTTNFCGVNGRVLTVHLVNWKSESRRRCPSPPEDAPELGRATAMALIITVAAKKTVVKNNFMFNACSDCLVFSTCSSRSEVTHSA